MSFIQVVTEMEATHHDGGAFARLFVVAEGGELAFPTSVYEIMNTFCQTTYRSVKSSFTWSCTF